MLRLEPQDLVFHPGNALKSRYSHFINPQFAEL
jgi:hypothetical protein